MIKEHGWKRKIEDESIRLQNVKNSKLKYSSNKKKVTIWLDMDDYDKLSAYADSENETVSTHCRIVIKDSIGKFKRSKTDLIMIGQINSMGHKINQIQKFINLNGIKNQLLVEFWGDLDKILQQLLEINSKI